MASRGWDHHLARLSVVAGRIQEITSFYDSAPIRDVLSPSEQAKLGGPARTAAGSE